VASRECSTSFRKVNRPRSLTKRRAAIHFSSDEKKFFKIVVQFTIIKAHRCRVLEEAGTLLSSLCTTAEKARQRNSANPGGKTSAGNSEVMSKVSAVHVVSREIATVAVKIGVGGYQPHLLMTLQIQIWRLQGQGDSIVDDGLDHIGLRGDTRAGRTRGECS